MVTITLLPRPGPVTLQEAGATAQSRGARLLWSVVTCRAMTLREGWGALCTSWPGVKPSLGESSRQRISASWAVVCVREPALLV